MRASCGSSTGRFCTVAVGGEMIVAGRISVAERISVAG